MQTNVLRVIATRVIPLIVASGAVTGALAWLQDAVGLDLPTEVLAAAVFAVLAGITAIAFAYVKNHAGAAKLGAVLLELMKLKEEGEQARREYERLHDGGQKRIAS